MRSFGFFLARAVALSHALPAQTAPTAEALLRAHVERLQHTDPAPQQSFTFVVLHHDLNYTHGKLTSDHSFKTEQIFIGGLPYRRRIERDGKPLTGKELAHETELYDKAVAERKGLTEDQRSALAHAKTYTSGGPTPEQFPTEFHAEIAGRENVSGRECTVLDLTPLHPGQGPAALQRHIRLSLDNERYDVLHLWTEFLAESNGFSKGTTVEGRNAYLEGTLLPVFSSIDTTVSVKAVLHNVNLHVIGTDEFSGYRRFRSTIVLRETPDSSQLP